MRSPDPRIRVLSAKFDRLQKEAARIDRLLDSYLLSCRNESEVLVPQIDLLGHCTLLNDELCGCTVCANWIARRDELARAMKLVPSGHRWSICACQDCRFVGRMQLNYMAAANLRDLLIEVSFHAAHHSRYGNRIMQWFAEEITTPRYSIDWCAYELGRRPVDEWLDRCEKALSPILSGVVFATGAGHQTNLLSEGLGSQLGDTYVSVSLWTPSRLGEGHWLS